MADGMDGSRAVKMVVLMDGELADMKDALMELWKVETMDNR